MKKYIKVLSRIIFARAGKELELRFNLLFEMLGGFIFFILHLIAFKIVLSYFSFSGWTTDQLWILMATFLIFTYMAFFLFWKGLTRTVEEIRLGVLDSIIVKPINARFISFLRSGGLHNFAASFTGVLMLVYFLFRSSTPVSALSIALYFTALILSLWMIHCLTVTFVSLNFFFGYLPESSGFGFNIQEGYKYPSNVYLSRGLIIKLIFIPISLLTTFPVQLLLSKPA